MKKTLFLIFILGWSFVTSTKKAYYSLEMLTSTADLIVVGEITKIHNNSYEFSINHTVKGDLAPSITV